MATASHDSSSELRFTPRADAAQPSAGDGELWLDGGVLACACPDCGAPMSIRLWLLVADCWRCGASFELTEEQEQAAYRLLREHEAARQAEYQEAVAAIAPEARRPRRQPAKPSPAKTPAAPAPLPSPAPPPEASPAEPAARSPVARRVPAAQVYRSARARVQKLEERAGVGGLIASLFDDLPAWFVSMVVHAVGLILLGMWFTAEKSERHNMVLATSISPQDIEGEQGKLESPEKAFEFDAAGALEFKAALDEAGMALQPQPELQRLETPVALPDLIGRLPENAKHLTLPHDPMPPGKMFAGRDPALRAQLVKRAGGSTITEVAVARGLKFLARHQQRDGSWSFRHFNRTDDCDETCSGAGHSESEVAATALALLPFLGAGQTHLDGQYQKEVRMGLNYLCDQQRDNGDLRGRGDGRMYAHGQAAIVLGEAYALTGDDQLRAPAQLAIDFIVRAQHRGGGWRYEPGEAGDTSVVGWQLMALKSAQMANLNVPDKTFTTSGDYLDKAQTDRAGGKYAYQPGHQTTPAMTAEALLCRQYLGWPKDHAGLKTGVEYLLDRLPEEESPNIYYWYYATQVLHHFGGDAWKTWNDRMRTVLVTSQATRGHAAGSWAPRGRGNDGGFADRGGRLYMTALCLCTLEVYYRHLPLYGEDVVEGLEGFR